MTKKILELKQELDTLESNKVAQNHTQEKKRLKDLQHRIAKFKNNVIYQLNNFDLYSIGEITQTKSSLTNVLLNFRQTKALTFKKYLGHVSVEYADTLTPTKISGSYNFL